MSDVQVTCINKPDRQSAHEGITHLGGTGWRWTRDQVIRSIENGTNTFFTNVEGKRANVRVVDGRYGKYVRTYADNEWRNDLLALNEC